MPTLPVRRPAVDRLRAEIERNAVAWPGEQRDALPCRDRSDATCTCRPAVFLLHTRWVTAQAVRKGPDR